MESNNNSNVSSQSSFWQFSDQLRVHSNNLANLSLNDSIWSVNHWNKGLPEDRRNFDIRVGGNLTTTNNNNYPATKNTSPYTNIPTGDVKLKNPAYSDINKINNTAASDFGSLVNKNDFSWKIGSGLGSETGSSTVLEKNNVPQLINGGFNKGIYNYSPKPTGNQFYANNHNTAFNSSSNLINNHNLNVNLKGVQQQYYKDIHLKNEFLEDHHRPHQIHGNGGKKKNNSKKEDQQQKGSGAGTTVDKRFKTLPPSEALPKNEMVGGYIFVCNNDTMEENLRRQLFGLPPRYRDSVRAITPGLPLFLYNYSTHQLHGIYEASSFGASNIDPKAWEDKKNPGESRFPAQVRVQTRKICVPLEEDAFRPILHHYDGPKFRLELTVPEALSLLDIFAESSF